MAEAKQVDFLINGVRDPLTDEPLSDGKVYTYEAGTSTPANLYVDRDTDEGEATNPVILDAYGRAEVFGNGVYKFVVTDADDVTVIEMDNLEYYAVISDIAIPALTANLDFGGYKGTNMVAGTEAGDGVEYAQFDAEVSALEDSIDDLSDAIGALSYKFTDLTDTPSTLSGEALKLTRVNAGATAIELASISTILAGASILSLSDMPAAFTGNKGKVPLVNTGETAMEFGYPDAKTLQGIAVSATPPVEGDIYKIVGGVLTPTAIATSGITKEILGIYEYPGSGSYTMASVSAYTLYGFRIDSGYKTYTAIIDVAAGASLVIGKQRWHIGYNSATSTEIYLDLDFDGSNYIWTTNGGIRSIIGYK
jgi:hypothetical protein